MSEKNLFLFFLPVNQQPTATINDKVIPPNSGAIGCNFCNAIKIFNHRYRDNIIWILCKNCQFVVDKAGPRYTTFLNIPGHRFTRPPCVDLTGPHGIRTVPTEQFYWDTGEKLPEYENTYHLLDPPQNISASVSDTSSESSF